MTKLRIREASSDPDRGELVAGIKGGKMMPDGNLLKTRKEYYAWRVTGVHGDWDRLCCTCFRFHGSHFHV